MSRFFMGNISSGNYQKNPDTLYAFVLLVAAIGFGVWFALNQINAVASAGVPYYPVSYFLLTVMECVLTVIVFYLLNRLVMSFVCERVEPGSLALSYGLLWLVLFSVPIKLIIFGIIFLQLLILFFSLKKSDYGNLYRIYAQDGIVLFALIAAHVVFTSALSPLHWKMALLTANGHTSGQVYPVSMVFKGYVLAKQFSFSFIDHAQWAGIMNPPATLSSPFVQVIAFILDLPSIGIEAFHKLIMSVNLLLAILGSFGFYLFLKYAGRMNVFFSFFGGVLFFFSGTPFMLAMFSDDAGIFLSPYAAFPYALLFISLAFVQKDKRWACWAGAALASPFFFMAPHPEGIIYSTMFFGIYAVGLCLFHTVLGLMSRLVLLSLSVFSFVALSSFMVLPIMLDRFEGNMNVFGHIGDVAATPISYYTTYMYMLLIFIPVSIVFTKLNKRLSSVYLSALFLSIAMLCVVGLTTQISVMTALVKMLHISIHFWVLGRLGMYFFLSVAIIVLFGLQEFTITCFQFITKQLNLKWMKQANE